MARDKADGGGEQAGSGRYERTTGGGMRGKKERRTWAGEKRRWKGGGEISSLQRERSGN